MSKVMNFTSQICTTKVQSERLLALGLKQETADCCLDPLVTNPNVYVIHEKGLQPVYEEEGKIPAWSLHRLIETCPLIPNPSRFLAVTSFKLDCSRKDTCYRYIAYLHAKEIELEYISVFKPLEKVTDQCEFYWKYEK